LKIDLINVVDLVSRHVVIHVSSSKREIIFWFWAAIIFFSSSRVLREKRIEVIGWGSVFFVIYRKRLIDGIFAAASCCICFSPLS
jgi:hypothetical protein